MINTKNFNSIRIVSMFCVLAVHSTLRNVEVVRLSQNPALFNSVIDYKQIVMDIFYGNFFKAMLIFFIISGYLFQMQYSKIGSFATLMKKKTNSLLKPYFLLFILPTLFITLIIEPNFGFEKVSLSLNQLPIKLFREIILTNYWFVPALFVTLALNYFIKTELLIKSLFIFVLLWAISYLNIYLKFSITSHTVWFPGFFLVFTIGRIFCIKQEQLSIIKFLQNRNLLILITTILYLISSFESLIIFSYTHNIDYLNNLRIANILFSISFFFLLNNLFQESGNFPFEISTFFIYLIHPFILKVSYFLIDKYHLEFAYPNQILFNLLHLVIVLSTCIIIHNIFFSIKFKFNKKYLHEYIFKNKIKPTLFIRKLRVYSILKGHIETFVLKQAK